MKLYWCEQSRAFRIVWMLEELGRPYERIRVDIRGGDMKDDPEFRSASPMGKVPALIDGTTKLWDSGAICLYLCDQYPEAGLGVSIDDPQRGAFLQWLMYTNAVIEPAMVEKFMGVPAKAASYGHGSFDSMVETLAAGIAPGPWVMGDTFTAADVLLGSSVYVMDKFNILPDQPELKAYVARCLERPAFQTALALDNPES